MASSPGYAYLRIKIRTARADGRKVNSTSTADPLRSSSVHAPICTSTGRARLHHRQHGRAGPRGGAVAYWRRPPSGSARPIGRCRCACLRAGPALAAGPEQRSGPRLGAHKYGLHGSPVDLDTGQRSHTWLAVSDEPAALATGRYWHRLRQEQPASEVMEIQNSRTNSSLNWAS